MSLFITFHDIMMSQPDVFQNTGTVKLGAAAQMLGQAGGVFSAGSAVMNQVKGNAQTQQSSQATQLISQGAQLASGVTQTANMINSSASTMKAAKTRLTGLVAKARAEGFLIEMATGVVTPNPGMLSGYHAAYYTARAAMYNDQIQTVVFQVNAQDISVKLGLAATALNVVNFVMGLTNGSGNQTADPNLGAVPTAGTLPTTGALPGNGTYPVYTTPPGTTPTSPGAIHPSTVGSLPGVSGTNPQFGLAGAGSLGASAMTGAGALGAGAPGLGGASGPGALGSGTSTAGVSSLSGAGQPPTVVGTGMGGASGASGGSMVGMGGGAAGGAGRDRERRESNAWRQLTEDENLWGGDDIPDTNDGVLS